MRSVYFASDSESKRVGELPCLKSCILKRRPIIHEGGEAPAESSVFLWISLSQLKNQKGWLGVCCKANHPLHTERPPERENPLCILPLWIQILVSEFVFLRIPIIFPLSEQNMT